jgi:hypothetical protein
MANNFLLGVNCKLYRKVTGTPNTWSEIANCRDLDVQGDSEMEDVTIREGGGFKQEVATVNNVSVTFQMVYQKGASPDANFAALQAAYFDKTQTPILAAMDGAIDAQSAASHGLVATFTVKKFHVKQPIKGVVTVDVEVVPTIGTTPSWSASPVAP